MSNLIAYIPVLNQRHLDWFKKHPSSYLFLIPQAMAEELVPRLARNMAAVPTEVMIQMIQSLHVVQVVTDFAPDWDDPNLKLSTWKDWVLPEEDVSVEVVKKYLNPAGASHKLEMIWSRWDMIAVTRSQPVIADVTVSNSILDNTRMWMAQVRSTKSPDWWRQIGAVAFRENMCLCVAYNTHMPDEYETYIFGDPRLNVDAGQKGKYCSLHAERAIVAECAREEGLSLRGASLYVTTFPCEDCAREIAYAGVSRVFFREGYSVLNAQEVLRSRGVQIIQIVEDPAST